MSIVNPLSTTNPVVQTQATPAMTAEERQVDLRLEQIVRATVVDGGLDKPLLEMNHRHYRAQSDIELQVGQKLTLQVLQTHPRLEFRVLNDPLSRLSQLLPLLTRPYDWAQLLGTLQQQAPQGQLPATMPQVFDQLQQLLQPLGIAPESLQGDITKLAVQLQQLVEPSRSALASAQSTAAVQFVAVDGGPLPFTSASPIPQGQFSQLVTKFVQGLQAQLAQLPENRTQPAPQQAVAAMRELLSNLPLPANSLSQLSTAQQGELLTVLGRVQQQANLPPQLAGDLARLAEQLTVAQQRPVGQEGHGTAARAVQQAQPAATSQSAPAMPAGSLPSPPVAAQTVLLGGMIPPAGSQQQPAALPVPEASPLPPVEIAEGIERILGQVRQLQTAKGGLTADLTGRLEGLLDKLRNLPQPTQASPTALPGLEVVAAQLSQVPQQASLRPEGGQLGFLSQLFGFHLETELLNGKKKDALASLKLGLLALRDELGEQAEEPLRRLETLQMCKAKLNEEQVQFLPLPFEELEEGYLLVEKQREQEDAVDPEAPLQLSLSLRLSALGSIRIDMLYEKDGLHLRVACEDKEKMSYLQEFREELEQAIETVPLQGVSYAADAQVPTRQLMERLLPDADSMLDARI